MSTNHEASAAVYHGSTVLFLARLVSAEGAPLQAADVSAAGYTVAAADPCRADLVEPVSGHEGVSFAAELAIYETLQTAAPWDADATGYNFRHELDASENSPFPSAGTTYFVTYTLRDTNGQPIVFRYRIEAI